MIVFIFALFSSLWLVSCDKDVDRSLIIRSNNEGYFDSFADSLGYKKVYAPGTYGDNFIYLNYINKVNTVAVSPIYTSYVKIRYKKYTLESWVRNSSGARPISDNYTDDIFSPIQLNSLSVGEAIALQSMKVGEHIRCAIPWYLTNDYSGKQLVPPYTALFVDIELVGVDNE